MKYKLVIAEKPSVGKSIAKVLGASKPGTGFVEGSGYIVSWCMGHLADLAGTEVYDKRYSVWRYTDLPIIPEQWKYSVYRDKKGQFDVLKDLMNRSDVYEVINACDAGREGERIFRNVYRLSGCKKPVKRLWISSMEDKAVLDGFNNLKPGSDYDNLYYSAECRAKADWLVGINMTRLLSSLYHKTLKCGRVMSPTLEFIVERNKEITEFKPEKYYTLKLDCGDFAPASDKISDKETAEIIAVECSGQGAVCTKAARERKSEKPPLLYDLTSLQRDANRILGYTAQETLDTVQSLYEKKICTYPRTDSKYLTDDMEQKAYSLIDIAAKFLEVSDYAGNTKKVCDGTKVTDHYAIVPTEYSGSFDISALSDKEKAVFELIARRLLSACSGEYVYESVTADFDCGKYKFKYKYKKVIEPGWRAYSKSKKDDEISDVEIVEGEHFEVKDISVKDALTKPKAQFSEDTLLSAMENASAKEMPADAERKGLGTPATRAGIIEKLVNSGFVKREKGKLVPTQMGVSLMAVVPDNLKSAMMTAEWEHKLKNIEKGIDDPGVFISDIIGFVGKTVENYKTVPNSEKLFPSDKKIVGKCPRCGGNVTVNKNGYFCETVDCRFALWKDNKFLNPREICLTENIAAALLDDGKVKLNKIKSLKNGKYYSGFLVLDDNEEQSNYRIQY